MGIFEEKRAAPETIPADPRSRVEIVRRLIKQLEEGRPICANDLPPVACDSDESGNPPDPPGFEADANPAAVREYHVGYVHGSGDIQPPEPGDGRWMAMLAGPRPYEVDPASVLFLDVESTGLSGGTGTYAFLIGVGWFTARGLTVEQYFLKDPAEEAKMLEALSRRMKGFTTIVTFNGKCFDWPLLETRFAMNGLPTPVADPIHLDLIYPSRRLWGTEIPDCCLPTIERNRLGIERGADVHGWQVPKLYFRYLSTRDPSVIEPVFKHNRMDVLAVACLLKRVLAVFAMKTPSSPSELMAAARYYEGLGLVDEALRFFKKALSDSAEADERQGQAIWGAVRCYRKLGRYDDLRDMIRMMHRCGAKSPDAWIEASKYLEHRAGLYSDALEAAKRALALVEEFPRSPAFKRDLLHRIARLERKSGSGLVDAAGVIPLRPLK